MTTYLVVAKAPVAGQVKTRLQPHLTAQQAADVAAAALLDTLDAVAGAVRWGGGLVVVALTGRLDRCTRRGEVGAALARTTVIAQRGPTFARRLVAAHAGAARHGRPVLQIGMDTPQLTPDLLRDAGHLLGGADAVLGPASDGGWWALGLRDPRLARGLRDVPMSRPDTGALTRRSLGDAHVLDLPELADVDEWADALAVAQQCPDGRFAEAVRLLVAAPHATGRVAS